DQQILTMLDLSVYRFQLPPGTTPAAVIRALSSIGAITGAAVNSVFQLTQQQSEPAARSQQAGDSAQYILGKLRLSDLHRQVKGTNVIVAVIDSEIDAAHPDLEGVIAERLETSGAASEPAHPHGTGMAGAIASHRRLL